MKAPDEKMAPRSKTAAVVRRVAPVRHRLADAAGLRFLGRSGIDAAGQGARVAKVHLAGDRQGRRCDGGGMG